MPDPVALPLLPKAQSRGKQLLSAVLNTIYPPMCISCSADTVTTGALCGPCWANTYFIHGTSCDCCGSPLPEAGDLGPFRCDSCVAHPPSWDRGRAAAKYDGSARRIMLSLKHGDRHDIARPMSHWMASAAADLLESTTLIAPVPLHWRRLMKRKFNQSALLGHHISLGAGIPFVPDLLQRKRNTQQQKGMNRQVRQKNQENAFRINPKHRDRIEGQNIVLIDDVLTTGATLSSCAEVLRSYHPEEVNVVVFARVAGHE